MSSIKILLIQPPIQDFYETDIRLQPIGLCYLKSIILQHFSNCEVKVMDFHCGKGRRTIPIPKALKYLKPYYEYPDKSPFSVFYHYYHFGASFEDIGQVVAKEKPDLVGISSLFTPYYQEVIKTAEAIKKQINVPVLLGGSHVSAMPEQMLKYNSVDFVIRGEGEKPLVEFIKCWSENKDYEKVSNLGFKKKGQLILNPLQQNYPFSDIPIPDYSDFEPTDYLYEKKPLAFITTSRGCAYKCTFCSVHTTFGNKYRKLDTASIFDEIVYRYQQGFRVFDFEDDDLTFNKQKMLDLCAQIQGHFKPGDIELLAMNGISYMNLDNELLIAMKSAGFSHLNLSLVSSNTVTRKICNRPHQLEKYQEIIRVAYGLKFQIVSYQIIGLPFENLDAMIETLILQARLPVLIGASMFYLPPGSPISKQFPLQSETDLFKARLTSMAIETEHFQRSDIYTLFITIRIINFIKGLNTPENKIDLNELLDCTANDDRKTIIGISLLRRLFTEKKLYTDSSNQYNVRSQFDFKLFRKIWNQLLYIQTQNDKSVVIL